MKKSLACALIALVAAPLLLTACTLQNREKAPALLPAEYTIAADLNVAAHTLDVTTKIAFSVPQDDVAAVKLRLYANAYENVVVPENSVREAYSNGLSYGGCEIKEITADEEIKGYDVGVEDSTLVTIRLAQKHKQGDRVTLTIGSVVTLANVKHRLGYAESVFQLSGFYPELCVFEEGKYRADPYMVFGDPFYRETADYNVALSFPVGYQAAASAIESERTRENARVTCSYTLSRAREFAAVISNRLLVQEGEANGVTVRYYYGSDNKSKETLAFIEDAVKTYEEAFGAFPYPSYTVVAAPFFQAGMEYSGMAIVSDALSSAARKNAILHETAHQWWHGKVGSDEVRHPWQDEALAEYSVAYYYKKGEALLVYRALINNAADEYSAFAATRGDAPVDRGAFESEEEYYALAYCKGLLMMITLAEEFGFDRLNRALRAYADAFEGKIATPTDFTRTMEKELPKLPADYFMLWLQRSLPLT